MDTPAMAQHRADHHPAEGSHLTVWADGSWRCDTCLNKARDRALKAQLELLDMTLLEAIAR